MAAPVEPWNPRLAAWAARSAFALIGASVVATMVAVHAGWTVVAAALQTPFLLVCHRLPERTLTVAGTPMPLCSRCAGIWLGISVAGALAWPPLPLRVLRVVVPLAGLLMIADVVAQDSGLHPLWHSTRLLTGLLLGVPIGGGVGSVIVAELRDRGQRSPPPTPSAKARTM